MDGICRLVPGFRQFQFAALSTLCFALSIAVVGAETVKTKFNIESKPARQSLTDYARQAQVQLGFADEIVEDVFTNPVVGEFENSRALQLLLKDTGLEAVHGERGIYIRRELAESVGSGIEEPQQAVAETSSLHIAASMEQGVAGESTTQPSGGSSRVAGDESPLPIEEIVVTGTHIRGVDNVGSSSVVFTREELASTGYSTVEEVFESLPQNLDEISVDGATATGASRVATGNVEGASSISLRGLGPGSTLVLLNGKRRPGSTRGQAVDVSAIPLSMIERIEVVSGGASAIYGSDAVAGVVNVVTLADMDGAETNIYFGESPSGGERVSFSQTLGRNFGRGGFVLGYDYRKDEELDVTEAGVVRGPSPTGILPVPGLFRVRVPSEQHVVLFAGHYELNDRVEAYSDAHFSSDRNEGGSASEIVGCCSLLTVATTDSDQFSAVGGLRFDLGTSWQVDMSGSYGEVDNTTPFAFQFAFLPDTFTSFDVPPSQQDEDKSRLTSLSAVVDGPLGTVKAGTISVAFGVDFRTESYERARFDLPAHILVANEGEDIERDVWSVFAEIHLPLVNHDGQRLTASLAGRYDDYSDFGGTFNPQLGIEWKPAREVTIYGSYSEAFRAPNLFTLAFATEVFIETFDDPLAPGNTVTQFTEFGGNQSLKPEEADTWSVGVDVELPNATEFSLSYFNVKYEGRIDQPLAAYFLALQDESTFSSLINRNPTSAQLTEILGRQTNLFNGTGTPFDLATDDPLAVFPDAIIFDNRRNNIGLDSVDGIDFHASREVDTALGDWLFDLMGTYYLNFDRKVTANSTTTEQLNQPGRLIDLRLRGHIGWSRSDWSVSSYVNYVDEYVDTFAATPTKIESWTTVDLTVRYTAGQHTDSGFLDGVKVALGIDNLFDEGPPIFLSNGLGLGYDAANADPLGRFVSLRLTKRW